MKDMEVTIAPKREPIAPEAHISWPGQEELGGKSRFKINGDMDAMRRGQRIRVTIEGVVAGYSDQRYGGSLDVRTKSLTLESLGPASDEGGESMVDQVEALQDEE